MSATVGRGLLAIGETMGMVAPVAAERLERADVFRVDAGGAESNVAAHVAALGQPAAWYSHVGDDALGRRVVARVRSRGVDVSRVVVDSRHPTGLYLKDPGHGVAYYRAGSAAAHLDIADAERLTWDGIAVVHLSGITAALDATAPAFLDRVIDRARDARVTVSFDVNHRAALWPADAAAAPLLDLARRADIVFVGRDEAETLWDAATADAARRLLPETAQLVVKDGAVGATLYTGEERVFESALVVDVVEPVGAGDAFAGGYLAALLAGAAPAERLRAGHDRAALTMATTGDFPDDAAESPVADIPSERTSA
ncbi:PfkB family carbohydrate kinase [Microbacterium imperiale]|uniref:Carbohydrate kinase n=1 Tax=Microbacterium imperiale TaxID=33884 RepID=A0A9W6HIK2_9MICO|nr:PfkB family carbohydrate kinase [Microbacterium imperiale]MBP2421510.1 2-dehydro-3-deoxygluconokinase [Microbacterium imperiale]BFE41849.1 sugar kinase [Microbacterium imperiale]GLJ80801.1 carbohydrate kinase [Microbacterium imperiale]